MKTEIYEVVHEHFITDNTGYTTTLVEATSARKARDYFNKLAAKRRKYPYMWSDAESVTKAKILKAK